mgnify:CR=1 FL=1
MGKSFGSVLKVLAQEILVFFISQLLQREIELIDSYLYEGGNALLMLDPFTDTGLEKILKREL